MTKYINQISTGTWLTILLMAAGFVSQWAILGHRINNHEARLKTHDEQIARNAALATASYTTLEAHREQRASDAKLSDLVTRITRIETIVQQIERNTRQP